MYLDLLFVADAWLKVIYRPVVKKRSTTSSEYFDAMASLC